MKTKLSFRSLALVSTILTASLAQAASYYWDTNGTTAGLGDTAGTWGVSSFQVSGFPSFSLIDGTYNGFSNTATTGSDQIFFGTNTLALGSTASTIGIDGAGVTINSIAIGAGQGSQAVTLSGGGGSVTLAGTAPTIIASNIGSNTIAALLDGTAGMTKSGTGTVILTANNSVTGGITVAGGTLQVGNGAAGSLNSQALTFSGTGIFGVRQADTSAQNIGLLTLSAGDGTVTSTAASGAAAQSVIFSSMTARTAGATGNFTLATNATASQNKIVLTSTTNAPLDNSGSNDAGLYFGGTEFARYDTTNGYLRAVTYGTDSNASILQGASASGLTVTTGAAADVKLSGAITGQNTVSLNTLNMGANSLTLTNTSQVLSVNGILSTGSTITTAGFLQSAISGGELVIRVNSGTLVVNPIVQNNTSNSALTKSGAGTLQFNSINTFSGTTTINAGIVEVKAGTAGGSAVWGGGGITLNQGSQLFLSPTTQAIQNTPGFSVSGPITLGGGAGTATLRFSGNDNKFVLGGGITGQAGVVQTLAISQGVFNSNGDRITTQFTGAIADGSSGTLGVSVDFAGATAAAQRSYASLSGPNSFTGNLTITNSMGLNGTGNNPGAWVTIGGLRHDGFSAPTLVSIGSGYLGSGADYSGNISISNGTGGLTTLGFLTSANQILRGVISGTGSLQQQGSGTVTLNAANTFSGTTTIAGGKVIMGNALALQNSAYVTTGSNGTTIGLDVTSGLSAGSLQLGGLSGAVSLASAITAGYGSVSELKLNPLAGSVTYSGVIANGSSGMILTKTGAGTQILSGNNTYTGVTTINAGTLVLSGTNTSSGYVINGGVLQITRPTAQPSTGVISPSSGTTLAINVGGVNEWTTATSGNGSIGGLLLGLGGQSGGTVSFTGTATIGFDTSNAPATPVYTGAIGTPSGATTLGINKLGSNTLVLTGSNTYAGGTTITTGTLQFAKLVSQPASGAVAVGTGTTLAVNLGGTGEWTTGTSGNGTIGGLLTGLGGQSGGTVLYSGSVNLGFDTTNASGTQTYSNAIANVGTTLGIAKLGTGSLILDGVNTFTGATTVNGGTLLLDKTGTGDTAALASTSALVLGGGNFQMKGKTSGTTTQTLGALTLLANTNGTITLDANGGTGTTLTLANAAPTRGVGSTLLIDRSIANTTLTSTLGLTAAAQTVTQGIRGYAVVKDGASNFGFAANAGGNIVRYTGAEVMTGSAPTASANVKTAPTNTSVTGTPYLTTSANPAYNSLSIDTSTATGANFLSLNGTVTLSQSAILMTGGNDFTIQSGTQLGANNTEVIVHQFGAGALTISSKISAGSGSLTKAGPGTLIVTNSTNAYTGSTTLSSGTLQYASKTAFGTSTLYLNGGTKLQKITEEGNAVSFAMANNMILTGGQVEMNVDFANAKDHWFSGVVSGTGSLKITGSGTFARALTLTGNNTFSGGVTLDTTTTQSAWIQVGNANSLGRGTLTINHTGGVANQGLGATTNLTSGSGVANNIVINNSATFNLGGTLATGNVLLSGIISGAGSLNKSDAPATTFTLAGANTYTGTTRVATGTLALGASNVLPNTSDITIGSATLNASTFTDSAGTLAVAGSAIINLGSGGALAFANSSAVAWSGSLNITGTFVAGSSIRFGTTSSGLTSGQLATISVNGSGAGTYSLNASGYLIVGGSPFATWSGSAAFDIDTNGDGVKNGLAWIFGAADKDSNALGLVPALDNSDTDYLIFNFRRKDDANTDAKTTIITQYSTTLSDWTAAVHDGSNIIITPSNDFYATGVDKVEVKIKRTLAVGGKLFVRLNASQTP